MSGQVALPGAPLRADDQVMTDATLLPTKGVTDDLERLRTSILRRVAGIVRTLGVEEHELSCELDGDAGDLLVIITGPPLTVGVRQALGVRVLDAVHADGRTFGTVNIALRT